MIYTEQTKKAINLMYEKHKNQKDLSGLPYVFHPFHVAEQMNNENETIVALLHDIVEDTDVTIEDLKEKGFSKEVIDAIKIMTHDISEDYDSYIKRIATNEIATKVKLEDLKHNSDLTRLDHITKYDKERLEKYKRAMLYLQTIITNKKEKNLQKTEKNLMEDGLLGFAVGDALGVPVEFTSRESRKKAPIKEMVGYGSHNVPKGTWSDDTSMTIACMDSIIENNDINYDDMMNKFCEWVKEAKYTATDTLFDIGITTRKALYSYYSGQTSPIESGPTDERSNGNGSLMRMLPIAIYLAEKKYDELTEVEIINNISSLTHGHEISKLGCKIYSDYIKSLYNGKSKEEAYKIIQKKDYSNYYSKSTIEKYSRILKEDISKLKENEISSSGYIVSTLEASLWCTLNYKSYKDAVIGAVNLGDDTDTVGAVVGGINGIIYGKELIPKEWLSDLKKKEYLEYLATKFNDEIIHNKSINHQHKRSD